MRNLSENVQVKLYKGEIKECYVEVEPKNIIKLTEEPITKI